MELYGFDNSRSHRVVWALEELAVDYKYHSLDFAKGEHRSPEFLAKNPGGKVPVWVEGDFILSESAAIVTYLADKYPEKDLAPRPGTKERGLYDQWMYFVVSELEQPLWTMGRHKFIYPEEKRVPQIMEVAMWEFPKQAQILDQGLGDKEFILGDKFSMADVMIGHTLFWARKFEVPLGYERLEKYADRLSEREGLKKAGARYQK